MAPQERRSDPVGLGLPGGIVDGSERSVLRAVLRATREPDLDGFLREALAGAREVCAATAGGIYLEAEDGAPSGNFHVHVPSEDDAERAALSPGVMFGPGSIGERAGDDGALLESESGFRLAVVPLSSTAGRLGLLALARRGEGPVLSIGDLEAAKRYAAVLAPQLLNAVRWRDLEDLAVRDDTTSCFNRRYFEEYLSQETDRARRFHTPLSLIFLDLDDLKGVNTAHGHAMGSRTLNEVAQRIARTTRRIDKIFRFGGDEFCIILPGTDSGGARHVAERVRSAIGTLPFLGDRIPGGCRLTASLGLASYPSHARTAEEMLSAADAAMRRVKSSGKNAVSEAPANPPSNADSPGDGPA